MSRSAARASIVGRGVGAGAGVLAAVDFGDGVAELGGAAGEVGAALGDSEHPSVSTTRESAVTTRRIHRHYVADKPAFTRAPDRPSGSQDIAGGDNKSRSQRRV